LVAHKNVTQRLNDPEEGRGKREERIRVKRREEDEGSEQRRGSRDKSQEILPE
jgi:hypothetical protein